MHAKKQINSKEIFSLALNLQPPWFIKDIMLEKGDSKLFGRLTIQIDFEKGARFTMSDGQEYSAYDTEIKTWQHLNFFEHECFISARVPRVQDNENSVLTVQVPWSRPGSGFTLLFEAFAMLLIEKEMPVNKVAKTVRVTAPRLWRVFNYWIKKAIAKDNVSSVEQIGIDETSSRKGHNYVTVTVDVQERRSYMLAKAKTLMLSGV